MIKFVGMILLIAFVAAFGKILFREYIKYETGKGVSVSVGDSKTDEIVPMREYNVDVENFNDTIAYIDYNCSEENGSVVRCGTAMDNIRRLCKKNDNIKSSLYVQTGFKTLCGADHVYACITLEKACALEFGDACWALARSKYVLLANELAYTQKACEAENGEAKACSVLGFRYEYGEGVRHSLQKAMEYYAKACDLGSQFDCETYKQLYLKVQ